MRVAILLNEAEARNGYLNLILNEPKGDPGLLEWVRVDSLKEFGDHVFPGEAEEVFIPNAIAHVDPNLVDEFLAVWVGLLAPNGVISIGGLDLFQICHAVTSGKMDEKEANQALYGNNKQACYAATKIADVLFHRGLRIERVLLEGLRYSVVASRPQLENVV